MGLPRQAMLCLALMLLDHAAGSLILYVTFDDGTAADDSGNGFDGTLEGAPELTTGFMGSALSFDGTDDYVTFPSGVTADIQGSAARTVCLWVQRDTTTWQDGVFFAYGDDGTEYGSFTLRSNCCSQAVLVMREGNHNNDDVTIPSSAAFDDGEWHHICETYDGTDLVVYFDGSAIATKAYTLETQSTHSLVLGENIGGHGWKFKGAMDEVYAVSYTHLTLPTKA